VTLGQTSLEISALEHAARLVFDTVLVIRRSEKTISERLKRIPGLVRSRTDLLTLTNDTSSPTTGVK